MIVQVFMISLVFYAKIRGLHDTHVMFLKRLKIMHIQWPVALYIGNFFQVMQKKIQKLHYTQSRLIHKYIRYCGFVNSPLERFWDQNLIY